MSIEIAQKYGIGVTYKGDDGGLYFKDEAGNVTSLTQPDQLAKVSSNDTTAGYLEGKLVAGSNVTLTTNNEGGNETLTISAAADNDEKTKVSSNDTTSGYLESKLVAGSNVTLTTNNEGGNETITIAASADNDEKVKVSANDTTAGFLNGKLVAGTNVTFTEGNDGGDETLTIAAAGGVTGFTGSQNTASPNNTVNASRLLVDATSTNADFVAQPKGTGALLAQLPDGAATGGNKRGINAVDLQTVRSNADRVASGSYAIVMGRNSRGTSFDSIAIGNGSQSTANYAVAIGESCLGSGTNGVAIGKQASATSFGTVAIGKTITASQEGAVGLGDALTASGPYSFASGRFAIASYRGCFARTHTRFASNGDCQSERSILRQVTTTDAQTTLGLEGSFAASGSIAISSDATYSFTGLVTARRTDADNESAGWEIKGVIDNNAGTTALVGTPIVTALGDDSAGVWDVTVDADNTNDALVIKVTGENGKTIRWGATVTLMKVAG